MLYREKHLTYGNDAGYLSYPLKSGRGSPGRATSCDHNLPGDRRFCNAQSPKVQEIGVLPPSTKPFGTRSQNFFSFCGLTIVRVQQISNRVPTSPLSIH